MEGFAVPWVDRGIGAQVGVAYVHADCALNAIVAPWQQGRSYCFWLGADAEAPAGDADGWNGALRVAIRTAELFWPHGPSAMACFAAEMVARAIYAAMLERGMRVVVPAWLSRPEREGGRTGE